MVSRPRAQIASRHRATEIITFVRAVAKRKISRMTAAAERNHQASAETERIPFLIHDLKIAFYSNRSIVNDRYLRRCQIALRVLHSKVASQQPATAMCRRRTSLIPRHRRIHFRGPRQNPSAQIVHLSKSCLPQKVYCLRGTLPASAVSYNFVGRIQFMYAPR